MIRLIEMKDHAKGWSARLLIVETMQLINAAGQLIFTNRFLGGEYILHGLAMLAFLWGEPGQVHFYVKLKNHN
jgi:Innexin